MGGSALFPEPLERAKAMKHRGLKLGAALWAAGFASVTPSWAELAVSGNDGKQPQLGDQPDDVVPDTLTVIDLGANPPRKRGQVEVAYSMIGEPTSVAVAHSGRFALVTASQKYDTANKVIPDDKLSVVDLSDPDHPTVTQTLSVGQGPSGAASSSAATRPASASSCCRSQKISAILCCTAC